jgi:predicted DNA-binding transcriptional regulator YafY
MFGAKKLRQYQEVVRYIQTHKKPSQSEILAHLEELDLGMSPRTFERVKKELGDLGYDVNYHRNTGYSIEKDNSVFFEDMDDFIQSVASIGFLAESLKDLSSIKKFVRLTRASGKGQEYIPLLLDACREQRMVTFEHYDIREEIWSPRLFEPYQLREEQGRWYITGAKQNDGKRELRTYGLDRIRKVVKTGDSFKKIKRLDPEIFFRHSIGVWSDPNQEPVDVLLEVDSVNWKLINNLPWHETHKKVVEQDGRVQFSLFVKPNMDLQRKIMAWAPDVKVLQPESVKQQIESLCKSCLGLC